MKHFLRESRVWILLLAAVIAAFTLAFSLLGSGSASPFSTALHGLASPFRAGILAVVSWAEGVHRYRFEYATLEEENERLLGEVARLRELARNGEIASRENERLYVLLGLREKRRDFVFESAAVISYSSSNWESALTLNKGSSHGISPNDCVISETGALVGIVREVGGNFAKVSTILDSGVELGGLLTRTDGLAVIEGDFSLMTKGKLKLSYLPEEIEFIPGDEVVTSGKGGIYPSGLIVGYVEEVRAEPSGMSRYAILTPEAKLSGLSQVFVIKEFDIVE